MRREVVECRRPLLPPASLTESISTAVESRTTTLTNAVEATKTNLTEETLP
jgi:hypothetical protein